MKTDADELIRAARLDVSEWTGAAADAYQRWISRPDQALESLARASDAMALITEAAGGLIAAVRLLVRDAIATVVSRLIVYAAEVAGTLGLATPLVIEQVSTLCAAWAAKITRWLKGLIASLRELASTTRALANLIEKLSGTLRRFRGAEDVDGSTDVVGSAARQQGGHSTRPRNPTNYEGQEQWANDAYDSIRQSPDADVIARDIGDAPRADGSTGFTSAEVESIRQHIFFEDHPLSDFEGGIVHRRYDASPDMAEAWLRLRAGRQRPEDIALLEHESAEARYYRDHPGATYEQAHAAANEVLNWQNQIPRPTHEDYSEPWG